MRAFGGCVRQPGGVCQLLTFASPRIAYDALQHDRITTELPETTAMTSPYVFALIAALTTVVFSSLTMLLLR